MKKKAYLLTIISCLFAVVFTIPAAASPDINNGRGNISYVYDYDNNSVAIAEAMEFSESVGGRDMGIADFTELTDVKTDGKNIYLVDAGTNRLVITDSGFELIKVIDGYEENGVKKPFGRILSVCLANNEIYAVDSGNALIIRFNADGTTKNVYGKPDISLYNPDYIYNPEKVAVDYAGNMYVIAKGISDGIIQLDEYGKFCCFIGAPKVVPNLADLLWRRFMTEEQISKMKKFIPTEYNSIKMDADGFMYVTSQSSNITPVAKLNSQGVNVIKTTGRTELNGDGSYKNKKGVAQTPLFVDVAVEKNGTYHVLDVTRGRVFTYDSYGELLFITGFQGSRNDSLFSPSAIEQIDDRLLISDKLRNVVLVYTKTEFAEAITSALDYNNNGYYDDAEQQWKKVVSICSNYYPGYINLAKICSMRGDYETAKEYYKLIGEKENYSVTFSKIRNVYIRKYFKTGIVVVGAIILLIVIWLIIKKKKHITFEIKSKLWKEIKYSWYIIFHPVDGFWDLKREKRGSIKSATIIAVTALLIFAARVQFSGYLVSGGKTPKNPVFDCLTVAIPLLLWCVSNWCFTSLMDGEGTFADIYKSTCYALTPYILLSPLLFIMSHILNLEELQFYHYIDTFAVILVFFLMFMGMMVTHDYSLGVAVITTVLTVAGILIIIFVFLLFVNLLENIGSFFAGIYDEIMFNYS